MSRDLPLSPRSSGPPATGGDAEKKPRRQAATDPDKVKRERAKRQFAEDEAAASRQQQDAESGSNLTGRQNVVYSYFVRQRIRACQEQAHGIVIARLRASKEANAQVAASYGGLASEVTSLALARKRGTAGDRRAALLSIAASCVILAEREDRPAEPKRGQRSPGDKRAKKGAEFQPYKPVDYSVPDLDAA